MNDPGALVLCCFCREMSERGMLLHQLRLAAGAARVHPEANAADLRELSKRLTEAWESGNTMEALRILVRWQVGVLGRGYHTYALKEGDPPYPWGVIVAFRELDRQALTSNYEAALDALRGEQARVMDIFGWGVQEE